MKVTDVRVCRSEVGRYNTVTFSAFTRDLKKNETSDSDDAELKVLTAVSVVMELQTGDWGRRVPIKVTDKLDPTPLHIASRHESGTSLKATTFVESRKFTSG